MSADEKSVLRLWKIGEAAWPGRVTEGATFDKDSDYAAIEYRYGSPEFAAAEPDLQTVFREDRSDEERAYAARGAGDYQEAARLFELLAERGSAQAHLNIGWMLQNGHLGPPDLDKAIAAFEKAAALTCAEAKSFLGLALLKKGDRERAEVAFREGAAEGDASCRSELMFLEETRAWEALAACRHKEAARLLEPLVAQGSTYAMVELGRIHAYGRLGAADVAKAMALWQLAIRLGSTKATYAMARSLRRSGDTAQARALFLEGAAQADKRCAHRAGRMLVRGEGGAADRTKGIALLVDAAERGHVYARRELLRLELNDERTLRGRLRVWGKIALLGVSVLRRAWHEPDIRFSDDFS
jgi:TPR repeat protein